MNSRYVACAEAHGITTDQMKGKGAYYIIWNGKSWRMFKDEMGYPQNVRWNNMDEEYDEWLELNKDRVPKEEALLKLKETAQ